MMPLGQRPDRQQVSWLKALRGLQEELPDSIHTPQPGLWQQDLLSSTSLCMLPLAATETHIFSFKDNSQMFEFIS